MFDWNDLKAFLAVARSGSTLGAAKALGVNQTTVARRLEALENALGVRLFERGQAGSRLTEAGRDLLPEAEKVERAAKGFADLAQARQRGVAGRIKLTCSELLANILITPAIARFRQQFPEVQVELVLTDDALDIAGGEADIAIRSARSLAPSDLVSRKLIDYDIALYCSREYAERRGAPKTPDDLKDHDLITCETPRGPLPGIQWMLSHAGGRPPAHICNSMSNLIHAVVAGLGIAPMGRVLGDADPHLLRCSESIDEERAASWLLTRRDLKDTPRIRAFIDFLVPFVQQDIKARLERARAAEAAEAPLSSPA